MNIFVSSIDPFKAARALDDKRLNKMLLESCQILSTAINECGGKAPYKSTHINHPSNIWSRKTLSNWEWLFKHAMTLNNTYYSRFKKEHKCKDILFDLLKMRQVIPFGEQTPFANCAANKSKGIDFKYIVDIEEAYRRYLVARWNTDTNKPRWNKQVLTDTFLPQGAPEWVGLDNQGKLFYKGTNYEILFNPNK